MKQKEPYHSKDTRIIERFLFFPKSLCDKVSMLNYDFNTKRKWLKKAKIMQRSSLIFYADGTTIICVGFRWVDSCWI